MLAFLLRLIIFVPLAASFAIAPPIRAEEEHSASVLSAYGFSVRQNLDSKPALVRIWLDQSWATTHLEQMKRMGWLNGSVTLAAIKLKPTLFASSLILRFLPVQLGYVYSGRSRVDHLHVVAVLRAPDLYGNTEDKLLFSFDFNRPLFEKINWDQFKSYNLIDIAPNFSISPEAKMRIAEESSY